MDLNKDCIVRELDIHFEFKIKIVLFVNYEKNNLKQKKMISEKYINVIVSFEFSLKQIITTV